MLADDGSEHYQVIGVAGGKAQKQSTEKDDEKEFVSGGGSPLETIGKASEELTSEVHFVIGAFTSIWDSAGETKGVWGESVHKVNRRALMTAVIEGYFCLVCLFNGFQRVKVPCFIPHQGRHGCRWSNRRVNWFGG